MDSYIEQARAINTRLNDGKIEMGVLFAAILDEAEYGDGLAKEVAAAAGVAKRTAQEYAKFARYYGVKKDDTFNSLFPSGVGYTHARDAMRYFKYDPALAMQHLQNVAVHEMSIEDARSELQAEFGRYPDAPAFRGNATVVMSAGRRITLELSDDVALPLYVGDTVQTTIKLGDA